MEIGFSPTGVILLNTPVVGNILLQETTFVVRLFRHLHRFIPDLRLLQILFPNSLEGNGVAGQVDELEAGLGLKITGLVNNTNLTRDTCAADLLRGEEIISEVSKRTGVPIRYTAYVEEVVKDMTPEIKAKLSGTVVPLTYYMRPSWM